MNKMCIQYNTKEKKKDVFFTRPIWLRTSSSSWLGPLIYRINKDECRSKGLSRGGLNNSTSKSLLEDASTVFLKTTSTLHRQSLQLHVQI